jgi:hypothetical protein
MASTATCRPNAARAAAAFCHGQREMRERMEAISSYHEKIGILTIMKTILNTQKTRPNVDPKK